MHSSKNSVYEKFQEKIYGPKCDFPWSFSNEDKKNKPHEGKCGQYATCVYVDGAAAPFCKTNTQPVTSATKPVKPITCNICQKLEGNNCNYINPSNTIVYKNTCISNADNTKIKTNKNKDCKNSVDCSSPYLNCNGYIARTNTKQEVMGKCKEKN